MRASANCCVRSCEFQHMDLHGRVCNLHLPMYYVPKSTTNLLSIQTLLQHHPKETVHITAKGLVLSGLPDDPTCTEVVVPMNPATNLPSCRLLPNSHNLDPRAYNASLTEIHDANRNLTSAEKTLLRWHQRLGHLSFKQVQFLLNQGVLARSEQD